MKIGIFDSGLGGLIIAKAVRKKMSEYDYVYLGDTQRVPYGNRSHETVLRFTRECVKYLFEKEDCGLVILACNTSSARALKELQKEFKTRKILGVLIPAAEEAGKFERVGVVATAGTVASRSFSEEIKKVNERAQVFQNSAPMLVPLAEAGETINAVPFIEKYLEPFGNKKLDALVLGCTHYPIFKQEIKKLLPGVKIISQDEIIPKKLKDYLARHPEIENKLSTKGSATILVTDQTQTVNELTCKWFGKIKPKLVRLEKLD